MIKKNIIIFGGQGFVGINICKFFLKVSKNYNIYLVGNKSKLKNIFNKAEKRKITFYNINLFNVKKLPKKIFNDSVVINAFLMSNISLKKFKNNYLSFCEILKEYNISKFILLSSISVYGNKKGFISNENIKLNPTSDYAKRCISAERITQKIIKKKIIILRIANIFGEYRQNKGTIEKLLSIYIFNSNYKFTNLRFKRTYIYINTLAKIIYILIKKNFKKKQIFNVGNPNYILNFNDIVNKIEKIIKSKLKYKLNSTKISVKDSICLPNSLSNEIKFKFKNNFKKEINNIINYLKKNERK